MRAKIYFSLFLVALYAVAACKTTKSTLAEPGMFKVTILYPFGEDKNFDLEYYEKKHMPMMAGFIGKNLKFYEIDRGISGRNANEKPAFAAIGYFYISDINEYNEAIARNREVVMNDLKNYTNIQPLVQVSEVRQVVK
jgi:uncharacterized protein (TIGR02118 family)